MPLKLVSPAPGRSPFYTIRGTHIGVVVYRSAKTADRKVALGILKRIERDIERGAVSDRAGPTFASAALAYINAGGDRRFIAPVAAYFKDTPLTEIDQAAIDNAAAAIYPRATPATRNRQVHTPVSAILKHVGAAFPLKRPKGHAGTARTQWLEPDEAGRLFDACDDLEFRAFLVFLTYTGARLSEALRIECRDVSLSDAGAFIGRTKNGEARSAHLPPAVVAALAGMDMDRDGYLFRFRKNGHLYKLMREAKRKAGLPWVTFHTCRHTYATWMRRYAGLDTRGLVGTGAWKSEKSAARYAHVVVTEESRKADLLPVARAKAVQSKKSGV